MKRWRGGIKLGRRLSRLWRRCVGPSSGVASRLLDWGRGLSRRLRKSRPCGGGGERTLLLAPAPAPPPKGHLSVYVGGGEQWQPPRRYVVPVVYFNHPLFGELLRESEEEFGFRHPGGITIPCPAAKFEHVRTRIAAAGLRFRRKSSQRASVSKEL